MPTAEQDLQQAWDVFEAAFGSATYSPNLERNFKSLFRNKVTWNGPSLTPDERSYVLQILLPWGGAYAAGLPNLSGVITADQLCSTFEAMQKKGYEDNGFSPTRLC